MTINDPITNSVATASALSPWWLPHLTEVSGIFAAVLPILGCTWLIIQIIYFAIKGK